MAAKKSTVPADPHAAISAALSGTSFSEVTASHQRLILSIFGDWKSGKTNFALTAPGPICYMSIDMGTEGVIEKFQSDKKIYLAEYNTTMPANVDRNDSQAIASHYDAIWAKVRFDYERSIESGARTIVWDTASEFYELCRSARFGKLSGVLQRDYGPVNAEFRDVCRRAFNSDCNLILLHKMGDEYVNNNRTGNKKPKGMAEIEGIVQATCRTRFQPGVKASNGEWLEGREPKWFLDVISSRHNAAAMGQVIEAPDFLQLGMLLCPETEPEVWL